MTDNFENMKKYLIEVGKLSEKNPKGNNDRYYVIELMRRGKDNPDLPAANVHFKNYYITCLEDYDRHEEEIKQICTLLRLRAYISVNYKLFSQVTLDTMAEYARRIAAHDLKRPYSIYESCSGKFVAAGDGKWVIDIDREPWMNDGDFEDFKRRIKIAINNCRSNHKVNGSNIIYENPSMTGHHLITVGFKSHSCSEYDKATGMVIDLPDSFPDQMFDVFKDTLGPRIKHIRESYENGWFPQELIDNPNCMIHENRVTLLYENL